MLERQRPIRVLAKAIAFAMLCAAARAGDGQTDVLPTGSAVFTISAPGSYVLAQSVTMTAAVSCINITASNVTLDLNGHTLDGAGIGALAINVDPPAEGARIMNGRVKSFTGDGIVAGMRAKLSRLEVDACGGSGIYALARSTAETCTAQNCQQFGIVVGNSSIVRECIADGNNRAGGYAGILAGSACVIASSTSTANRAVSPAMGKGTGIQCGFGCAVERCVANDNWGVGGFDGCGIEASLGCVISDCVASTNHGSSPSGDGVGVRVSGSATVSGNACRDNNGVDGGNGHGIWATGSQSTIVRNTCGRNYGGAISGDSAGIRVDGDDSQIRENTCDFNLCLGGSGTARGIVCTTDSLVEGNSCTDNDAGAGNGIGLQVSSGCRVVANHCANNGSSSGLGYGLVATGSNNFVASNNTTGNKTAGIRLSSGSGGNRVESNRMADGAVSDAGGGANSIGSGDLANIAF